VQAVPALLGDSGRVVDYATPTPAPLRPAHVGAAGLVAAAAAAAILWRAGPSGWNLVAAAAAALLVWVAAIDLETRLLPNRLILPATVVVLAASSLLGPSGFAEHALAALMAGGLLFVAAAVRPGDLGMGDAKLALLLGALLGRTVLEGLAIGFCLVAAAGLLLLARHGKPALKRHLPLGPFLAAGALAALLL
jgi:leader peptidase (prepilin peptidase) / N-methyltransferase